MAVWGGEGGVLLTLQDLQLHRIVVSTTYESGALNYHGAEFRQMDPLKVEAVAELVGSEIRIRGHLGTRLEACCDRCLGPVKIDVDRDFDLFYRPVKSIAREEEIKVPEDELGVGFYSGDGIELADVVTEQVILSVPMKLVCRSQCLGLCPICRVDRNAHRCRCSDLHAQSPFASLRGD